jgi:anaerobic selenocysteine-containing dehydrogenase
MGLDEPCLQDSDEALAAQVFKASSGLTLAALREQGWLSLPVPDAPFANGGYATPSGRARVGVPGLGLPDFVPPYESAQSSPELAAQYPLAMISPPARNFLNSSFVNVQSLRDIEGEPLLEMHPDDAAARGITDGTIVRTFNDRGSYRCKVRVGQRARPGVVHGLGIWWRKFGLDGRNVNELTHQRLTDLGAAPTFYDVLVQVELDPTAGASTSASASSTTGAAAAVAATPAPAAST